MDFDPRNLLVIDFGQLGDVVLSLPALHAVRVRFPQARITVLVGKPGRQIVELAHCADEVLTVDRVGLRDGATALSLWRIGRLVRDVRARRFDCVIDLHSLSETNWLGLLSGAGQRLYARRPNRSLDFLANFRPAPPVEDQNKHAVERYLDVLLPLGINPAPDARVPRLPVRPDDERAVEQLLRKQKVTRDLPLVGMFPGAGHPARRWPLERFCELADMLQRNDGVRTLVFTGPEEQAQLRELRRAFARPTIALDQLPIPQFAAALAQLSAFVSNNTGPMHVAAAVGTPVVALLGRSTTDGFTPVGARHHVVYSPSILDITTEQAYAATRSVLTAERAASLFAG